MLLMYMYNDSLVSIEQFTVGPRAFKTARKIREVVDFPCVKKLTCSSTQHLHCQDVMSLKLYTHSNYIVGDCIPFLPSAHVFARLLKHSLRQERAQYELNSCPYI